MTSARKSFRVVAAALLAVGASTAYAQQASWEQGVGFGRTELLNEPRGDLSGQQDAGRQFGQTARDQWDQWDERDRWDRWDREGTSQFGRGESRQQFGEARMTWRDQPSADSQQQGEQMADALRRAGFYNVEQLDRNVLQARSPDGQLIYVHLH